MPQRPVRKAHETWRMMCDNGAIDQRENHGMITQFQLTGFKRFQHASLPVGGLTILVGTNASGKSNLRDALRFINSIGGRFGEGGERIWSGTLL